MRATALAFAAMLLLAAWTPFPSAVGPEVPLDAPPLIPQSTVNPILATNGHGALLLSQEPRVSRIGDPYFFYWVGMLDENGAPTRESEPLGLMYGVSAASSGSGYLVTFIQYGEARAIRFSENGTRLNETPISLAQSETISEVTWDGTAYAVIAGNNAVSIAEDGRIGVTREVLPLTGSMATASRNGVIVVANSAGGPIYAKPLGGPLYTLGTGTSADIAAGDPGFFIAYQRTGSIYGRRLDASGAPVGTELFIATGRSPNVVWDGTAWLVVYETTTFTVRAARVSDAAVAPSFEISNSGLESAAAATDGKVFLAWDRHDTPDAQMRSATLEGDTLKVNGSAGVVPSLQSQPLMAPVDGATLVAWFDGATRVRRMDGASSARTIENAGVPVAFAAGEHDALLVSRIAGALLFTRVDRDGTPLSTQQYPRNYPIDFAGATWTGDRWMVVWRDTAYTASAVLVRAMVRADGSLETPERFGPILNATTQALHVLSAGSQTFVLWTIDNARTLTFLIDADGVARAGHNLGYPVMSAASRGDDVLTAGILNGAIQWQRVLLDGKVAARGAMPLPAPGMTLQTFFTGDNYLILLTKTESAPNRLDLYGIRVDASGAAIDVAPMRFSSAFTTLPPSFVTATLRDATTIDLAYVRALDAQSPRLVFRTVHDSPRRRVVR